MKYLINLLTLALLVALQSTLLPVVFPWLPLTPAFVYLVVLSFRLPRRHLLIAALWAGLVQDVLLGEFLGLAMLTNYIAMAVTWELKEDLLENTVLTGGLRIIAATLLQEVLMAFVYYIRGLSVENLFYLLQVNAGTGLLSNLLLYLLLLAALRTRGSGRIEAVLEETE